MTAESRTYPYYHSTFAFPLLGKSYTGIVYRVDAPGTVRRVGECGHNHRHPTLARQCAEAMARGLARG